MRKPKSELEMPGKYDLKGSGDIADLVDNIFIVYRNKKKEIKTAKGEPTDAFDPDCKLGVYKQRHGEWEGVIGLYFDKESLQYIPHPERGCISYKLF